MKPHFSFIIYLMISMFIMLFTFQKTNSQTSFIGNWKGIFMNDFKVESSSTVIEVFWIGHWAT
jgi:hypothetical protein